MVLLQRENRQREPYISGPDIEFRALRAVRRPWEYYRAARDMDLIIDIGGGDSLADIYGWKRFARMHLLKYLTHMARCPVILAPQTIGPFNSALLGRIAAGAIRRSHHVFTRDDLSIAALARMGITDRVIEASDVALRLPFDRPEGGRDPAARPRVGLNISGLLMSGGYTRDNMFGLKMDYGQLIRDIIALFLGHPDQPELHLVPHVLGPGCPEVEDDMLACRKLAEEFPAVTLAPAFTTPSEAKSYIAGLDFFMGARMHSCIAALSAGVPVVPMAYSRKFAGMFGSLGYDRTVDCTADAPQSILVAVRDAYEGREVLKGEVGDALTLGLARLQLYEDVLHRTLHDLAAAKRSAAP